MPAPGCDDCLIGRARTDSDACEDRAPGSRTRLGSRLDADRSWPITVSWQAKACQSAGRPPDEETQRSAAFAR
jgi:hypothetical protein